MTANGNHLLDETFYSLPEGWEWKTIGDIADTTSGGTPARNNPDYFEGPIPWVKSGELEDNDIYETEEHISEIGLKNSSAKLFSNGTVLVALYGATVGKTGILRIDATTNQAICGITPKNDSFIPEYLAHWLRYQSPRLIAKSSGGAQPNINQGIVRSFSVPIPSVTEQRRIVSRLESILIQIRTARTSLEHIPPLLKAFRQSVLAAAFRGELTERDPDDEPAEKLLERIRAERRWKWEKGLLSKGKEPTKYVYEEPPAPDTAKLPELPEGWVWTNLQTIADVRSGVTKGRDLSKFETIEVPYLRVANVQAGFLDLREVKRISIKIDELEGYQLQKNDVLYTEGGDRDKLGRGTVWKGEISPCIHQNHIFCARLYLPEVSPEWVSMTGQLEYARDYVDSVASQSVNLASINSTNLKAMPVPLPPAEEQKRIVEKIRQLTSQVEVAEQTFFSASRRLDSLEQAVLARAFRGALI